MKRPVPPRWIVLLAPLLLWGCGGEVPDVVPSPLLAAADGEGVATRVQGLSATGFNAYVLGAMGKFGSASYLWKGDGVTRKLYYRGSLVAQPYASKVCHCVGSTFQVYLTAFEDWTAKNKGDGTLKGLSVASLKAMRSVWYVASGGTEGSKAALVKYNLGSAVNTLSSAKTGDFVQFWRNSGSGHSVIFQAWRKSGGQITGLTYWSCNSGGPGTLTETVGSGSKEIDIKRIYIGRAAEPGPPLAPDAGPPPPDSAPPRPDARSPDRGSTAPDRGSTAPDRRIRRDGTPPGSDLPPSPVADGPPGPGAATLAGGCNAGPSSPGPGALPLLLLALVAARRRTRKSR